MSALRRLSGFFKETIEARLQKFRAARERFRLGITARLATAFVGMGALVLAANFIVEQVVLIEKTTQITRIGPQPAAVPKPLDVDAGLPPPLRLEVSTDALLSALDHFGSTVIERTATETEHTEGDYQRALANLDQVSKDLVARSASIPGKPLARLTSGLKQHEKFAAELVIAGDHGRDLVRRHAELLDGLNSRIKRSLDGSWKIFGRVLARQSLMQLSADVDALRRSSTALSSLGSEDETEMARLMKSERAVQKDLESNEKSFQRSEGDAWYTDMHQSVAGLASLRLAIGQASEHLRQQSQEWLQQTTNLATRIPRKIEGPQVIVRQVNHGSGDVRAASPEDPPTAVPSPVSVPTVVETHSVTTQGPHDRSKRFLMAWISILVLGFLAFIAVGTVLSIVRPVRRLLDATVKIARGDSEVRVLRGGVKELDTLAVAFNAMAEELAAARSAASDYQQSLEVKVAERTHQLKELAERDPLTALPNRRELFVLLNAALERARSDGLRVGVLFLDIDNFKYINSMGHAFGDRVLVSFAQRLQGVTQGFGFAARLGGDEFTVVLERAASIEDIRLAGLEIVQAFQVPLLVEGRELIVSVSVGASIYPDHEQSADALLKAADTALFRAKALGRSQLSVFTPELLDAAAAKFTTEQGLRRAVERGEFELVFQPEVSVETLETALVEALIRWRMPDGSLTSPGQFLAIAEESGLIIEISDWVLRAAVQAAAHWHHGAWPAVRVAINVSARQLMDRGFVDCLLELLRTHRLPPRCIEIELTESVLQTGPATIEALKRLRAHGVAIALDDFGTGYSSLASLEQLPLSRIKLDRSLIAGIDTSARSAAVAGAIISLCQGLGLEITAEGIERREQFAMLLGHRGMYLQGYLLARPTARDELIPTMADVAKRSKELMLFSQLENTTGAPEIRRPSSARGFL
jgi:diguanylate cyclase (GGDEF)-like protein